MSAILPRFRFCLFFVSGKKDMNYMLAVFTLLKYFLLLSSQKWSWGKNLPLALKIMLRFWWGAINGLWISCNLKFILIKELYCKNSAAATWEHKTNLTRQPSSFPNAFFFFLLLWGMGVQKTQLLGAAAIAGYNCKVLKINIR